jgi:hypothetical protein
VKQRSDDLDIEQVFTTIYAARPRTTDQADAECDAPLPAAPEGEH